MKIGQACSRFFVQEHLASLAKLAAVDQETQRFEKELGDLPAQIQAYQSSVAKLEALFASERLQAQESEQLLKEQRIAIEASHDAVAKAKAKGARAATAREADAAERELETNRRLIREREAEGERLQEALTQVQQSLAKHETELGELRELVDEEKAKAEARIAELRAQHGSSAGVRETLAASLPRPLLSRYERVRAKKGDGIAWVRNETCQACRMALPPQFVVVLRRAEDFYTCPSCHRILLDAATVPIPAA